MKSTSKLRIWYKVSGFALRRIDSMKEAVRLFNLNRGAHPYSYIALSAYEKLASHPESCLAYEHSDSFSIITSEFWQKPEALEALFYFELDGLE